MAVLLQGSGATSLQSVVPAVSTPSADERLRAAAEPFETLTEISPTAALPTIDRTINEAKTAARGIRGLLSNGLSHQLDAQLSAVTSARQRHDRVELALASTEAYRVLVGAVTTDAKVPTAINLLDYAGFRYGVDLGAKPVRWGDMAQAVSFARGQWQGLPPMTMSSPVGAQFDTALASMDRAVAQRNGALAAASAKTELDLVDQLEKLFMVP